MTSYAAADYAQVFEREFRPRRRIPARARRAAAYALLGLLFLVRPGLAREILAGR
jgi:hypothetical protein